MKQNAEARLAALKSELAQLRANRDMLMRMIEQHIGAIAELEALLKDEEAKDGA